MVTWYSVDVSVLFLCVISRPFSRYDDDFLPVTALLSKLVLAWKTGKASTNTSSVKKKEGLRLHECATIYTYMYRHMHECVQSGLYTQRDA